MSSSLLYRPFFVFCGAHIRGPALSYNHHPCRWGANNDRKLGGKAVSAVGSGGACRGPKATSDGLLAVARLT